MKIEERGADKAALNLRQIGVRASDLRPLGNEVGHVVAKSNERRFETRGKGRWKPLDDDTVRIKQQQGYDPRILRRTGALHQNLTAERPLKAGSEFLLYGTTVWYARFANSGTPTEPKRKLISLTKDERAEITGIIGPYVTRGGRRRRRR